MSSDVSFEGEFWIAGDDAKRSGVLDVGPGKAPEVDIDGELTPSFVEKEVRKHDDGTVAVVSGPTEHETLTGPVLIHGLAATSVPVTLLDAVTTFRSLDFLLDDSPRQQRLRGNQAIVGGHLSGRDHQFSGARVRLQNLNMWTSLIERTEWASEMQLSNGGSVVFEVLDSGVWLRVSRESDNLRNLDRSVVRPLISLLSLATSRACELLALQVRDLDSGQWWDVYSASQLSDEETGDSRIPLWLLPPADLRLSNIQVWLDQVQQLGPLPAVVADLNKASVISLETQVLQLTTVSEGLHRALFPQDRRMDDETAEAIRKAAVSAAHEISPESSNAVRGLLSFLSEPGYGPRIKRLARATAEALPGVTGNSISKWASMVSNARNDFAHRLRPGFYENDEVDSYLTTAMSLQWLLTGLLLLRAGVPAAVLAARLADHEPYQMFLKYAQLWKPSIYGQS